MPSQPALDHPLHDQVRVTRSKRGGSLPHATSATRLRDGLFALAVAIAVLTYAAPARADFSVWMPVEIRVPMVTTPHPTWPRLDWRVIAEARFATRFNGVEALFVRMGPLLYLSSWSFLAVHATAMADAQPTSGPIVGMDPEIRFELEPNFFGRIGPITLASRNRFEYRWRQWTQRIRLRTQLRVNIAPPGTRVVPFAQGELLFDMFEERTNLPGLVVTPPPPTPAFNQFRIFAGVGFQITPQVRADVAVLFRARRSVAVPDWTLDVGPWINLYFDAPHKVAPPAPSVVAPVVRSVESSGDGVPQDTGLTPANTAEPSSTQPSPPETR